MLPLPSLIAGPHASCPPRQFHLLGRNVEVVQHRLTTLFIGIKLFYPSQYGSHVCRLRQCNIVASASTHHSLDYSNCYVRAHACIPIHYTETVTATLEMESYSLAPSNPVSNVQQPQPGEPSFIDAIQSKHDTVMDMMQQLMDKLETEFQQSQRQHNDHSGQRNTDGKDQDGGKPPVVCRRCGKEGHYSRGCAAPRKPPGNE